MSKILKKTKGQYIISQINISENLLGARYKLIKIFKSFNDIEINNGKDKLYFQYYNIGQNNFRKVKLKWNWRTKKIERKIKK